MASAFRRILARESIESCVRQFRYLKFTSSAPSLRPLVYRKCVGGRQVSSTTSTSAFVGPDRLQAEQTAAEPVADDSGDAGVAEDAEVIAGRTALDPKDRSRKIPLETSIRYMKSDAYRQTYGDEPVWKQYRRNFKGQFAPKKTRRTCIRNNRIATGSPCPICRDEYLVVDALNVDLLKQFVSEHTGEILETKHTGVCRVQQLNLKVAILRAQNMGLITFDVPFRTYNYDDYRPSKS